MPHLLWIRIIATVLMALQTVYMLIESEYDFFDFTDILVLIFKLGWRAFIFVAFWII